MALVKLEKDGYGQIELNNVAFRRDGRIEAQCKLDDTDFATIPAENGMLLAVDEINKTIKFAVDGDLPIALNYTAEHMYDERKEGLKNFSLERGTFLPRLGYLATGDKFTTNCVGYDDGEWATEEKLKTALDGETKIYGGVSDQGIIKISATKPTYGPVMICKKDTMPDGQFAIKFHVLTA